MSRPALVVRKMRVSPQGLRGLKPTVTVVIPCYNYAPYLSAAVGSALSQSGVHVDIVIVDDASSDDSLALARALAANDARITVLAHDRNAGPVQTFNDGLSAAQGEYLVRLDADDLLAPGSLARSVAVAQRYPSVGLVYGHPLEFSDERPPTPRTRATSWTIWPGLQWLAGCCRSGLNVIKSPTVLMRTSVVNEVGGQQPLAHTHDMEMWLRMSAFSDVAYIHGVDQALVRAHALSLSRRFDTYRDLIERRAAFEILFVGKAGQLKEAKRLKADALNAIAEQALEFASREIDSGRNNWELVDELISLARATVPNAERVRGWSGLERRIVFGPLRATRHPRVFLDQIIRQWQATLRWRRWHRSGVF